MESFINAVVLGIVEGLTEFLPVSSTGHLIVVGRILGIEGEGAHSFEICIQAGAILAVVLLYYKRFFNLIDFRDKGCSTLGSFRGLSGIFKLGAACMPALVVGALFGGEIKALLFNPYTVAISFIVGGVVMILVERFSVIGKARGVEEVDEITLKQSLLVGTFQTLALCPGVSRSAATIIGGMFSGLSRRCAAEFSFIVAVPMLLAATVHELYKSETLLSTSDSILGLVIGLLVSFVSALFAIKFFISIVSKFDLVPFAVYRIVLGVVILLLF